MDLRTPISKLQELTVSKKEAPPEYTFLDKGNPQNPQFSCTVRALSIQATHGGRTKKDAKQKAAAKILEKIFGLENQIEPLDQQNISSTLRITDSSEACTPELPPKYYIDNFNYVGKLNEYAAKNRCPTATYDSIITANHFQVNCIFGTNRTVGYGKNKKQAKQIAACKMLDDLEHSKHTPPTCQVSDSSIVLQNNVEDELDSIILSRYQELSDTLPVQKKIMKDHEPIDIEEAHHTIDEAINMLKKLNLNYHIETIQTDPYLVVVQLTNGSMTTMGLGECENSATENAMNQVITKLSSGCSLTQ